MSAWIPHPSQVPPGAYPFPPSYHPVVDRGPYQVQRQAPPPGAAAWTSPHLPVGSYPVSNAGIMTAIGINLAISSLAFWGILRLYGVKKLKWWQILGGGLLSVVASNASGWVTSKAGDVVFPNQ